MNNKINNIIILIVIVLGSIIGVKEYLSNRVSLEELLQDNEVTEPVTSTFALMLEQNDGTYKESKSTKWPSNMKYNSELSKCIDVNGNEIDNAISYDNNTKLATVITTKTAYCYVYFDKDSSVYAKVIEDYTNNNGVKKLSDNNKGNRDYDTYYYRSGITNNNILYGGFCWQMLITTEGEGVKMIYNGKPSNGSCDNTGDAREIGKTAFNSSFTSLAYVGYMYNKVYTNTTKSMSSDTTEYVYGNTFTYSNGTYTLSNTKSSSWYSIYETGLNNNHYTCFNTSGICTSLYYIYYAYDKYAFYITLTDGKSVKDAINEMLYAEDVNKYDSTIKGVIDSWYESNLLNTQDSEGNKYSSYLQNTIYCNNRTMSNKTSNGWNANGGLTSTDTYFRNASLDCENKTDQFTLSADYGGTEGYGNNALKYPIGLLTYDEAMALEPKYGYLVKSGESMYLMTPDHISGTAAYVFIYGYTYFGSGNPITQEHGVRPVVSLSNKVEITLGDGSYTNPYQVKLNNE